MQLSRLLRAASFLLMLSTYGIPSEAKPNKVIIIRHAEKVYGKNHLDQRGYQRAAALPYYFAGTPLYNTPLPTHVFAAGLVESDSSVRPIETCSPIANHLKVPLNVNFKPEDTAKLAKEILTNPKYDKSNIIICWEHKNIRPLSIALGAEDPGAWDFNIFDEVYLLSYNGGEKPKLEKVLQKLMYGDRMTFDDKPFPLPPPAKKNVDEN